MGAQRRQRLTWKLRPGVVIRHPIEGVKRASPAAEGPFSALPLRTCGRHENHPDPRTRPARPAPQEWRGQFRPQPRPLQQERKGIGSGWSFSDGGRRVDRRNLGQARFPSTKPATEAREQDSHRGSGAWSSQLRSRPRQTSVESPTTSTTFIESRIGSSKPSHLAQCLRLPTGSNCLGRGRGANAIVCRRHLHLADDCRLWSLRTYYPSS